jgi:hypothetical protein
MSKIEQIESMLNLDNQIIRDLYQSWDKGDCSRGDN